MSAPAPRGLRVLGRVTIPADEIGIEAARAGGPGGQNVNKVATKVILRFDPAASRAFAPEEKELLLRRLAGRLNARGEFVLHASRFRERSRNLEDARERLKEVLEHALRREAVRRPTRPTRGSRAKRLESKRSRGAIKRLRGTGRDTE